MGDEIDGEVEAALEGLPILVRTGARGIGHRSGLRARPASDQATVPGQIPESPLVSPPSGDGLIDPGLGRPEIEYFPDHVGIGLDESAPGFEQGSGLVAQVLPCGDELRIVEHGAEVRDDVRRLRRPLHEAGNETRGQTIADQVRVVERLPAGPTPRGGLTAGVESDPEEAVALRSEDQDHPVSCSTWSRCRPILSARLGDVSRGTTAGCR